MAAGERMHEHDFRAAATWPAILLRAELLKRTRAFFEERGFIEVETPLLSADTVVDRHLDPIAVSLADDTRSTAVVRRLWLQTSPEFGMKRLLASGAEAIYQITRAFRLGERGPLHNPEFTMLEWYRCGDDMHRGMQLLGELAETLLRRGAPEQLSYRDAFVEHVGLNPHACSTNDLSLAARKTGICVPESMEDDDRDGWLDLLLVERVQSHLGTGRPTILYDFPASQAALARLRGTDPAVAERFELYVDGIELANGYHELLDPQKLAERNRTNNLRRTLDGKSTLPEESRLMDAMRAGLPACAGTALGFDRLVLIAMGAKSIDEVLAFPFERA